MHPIGSYDQHVAGCHATWRPCFMWESALHILDGVLKAVSEPGSELARGGDHSIGARPGEDSLSPLQRLGQTARHSLRTSLATTLYMQWSRGSGRDRT
eukprot:4732913-Pleurochrysis_carterae.AAC.1